MAKERVLTIPTSPEAVRAAIARSQGQAVGRAPRVPVLDLNERVKPAPKRRVKNKLEEAFGRYLEFLKESGAIRWYAFEPIRLRLAEGAWYKVDYLVENADRQMVCYEVKGSFWREAARVRIKVAAELHPRFKFRAVQKIKGEWVYEEFFSGETTCQS